MFHVFAWELSVKILEWYAGRCQARLRSIKPILGTIKSQDATRFPVIRMGNNTACIVSMFSRGENLYRSLRNGIKTFYGRLSG